MSAPSRRAVVGVAAASAAVAVVIIVAVANSRPSPKAIAAAVPAAAPHPLPGAIAGAPALEPLEARTKANPDDPALWLAYGRSLAEHGRFGDAAKAYAEAAQRLPQSAELLADRADVLAMAQGRRFDGEPDRLIAQALAADGRHVKALALAGTSSFNRGDYAKAAAHWRRILEVVPADAPVARQVAGNLAEAERLATSPAPR